MKKLIAVFLVLAVVVLTFASCGKLDFLDRFGVDNEQESQSEQGTEGLEYFPLSDGTYGVSAGTAKYCEEIIIPATHNEKAVTQIVNEGFKECTNLKSVEIPDSVTSIGNYAFNRCGGLTSVTIGNGVTSIGDCAFRGCSGLTSVTIPDSVTSIGRGAFMDCDGLISIEIPDSVTSISDSAFRHCGGLTSITIGNSVTSIGGAAFMGCRGLASITYQGTMEQWNTITNNDYLGLSGNCTIYCTDGNITKS